MKPTLTATPVLVLPRAVPPVINLLVVPLRACPRVRLPLVCEQVESVCPAGESEVSIHASAEWKICWVGALEIVQLQTWGWGIVGSTEGSDLFCLDDFVRGTARYQQCAVEHPKPTYVDWNCDELDVANGPRTNHTKKDVQDYYEDECWEEVLLA